MGKKELVIGLVVLIAIFGIAIGVNKKSDSNKPTVQ